MIEFSGSLSKPNAISLRSLVVGNVISSNRFLLVQNLLLLLFSLSLRLICVLSNVTHNFGNNENNQRAFLSQK